MLFKNISKMLLVSAIIGGTMVSCQKKDKPTLGDFPEDVIVTPTTPLRFFVSFDSTKPEDKQINIRFKDSISGYPSFFPDNSLSYEPGISGTAYKGNDSKNLVYVNSNDFVKSTSLSVAFWFKHGDVPAADAQFVFSVPSTFGHWSNSTMLFILDHKGAGATNELAVIKFMIADAGGDHWFELAGDNRMPGIYDNQWHHLAFTYDQTTSEGKFYKDGTLFPTTAPLKWDGHGPLTMDATKVTGFYLGGKTTDWGKAFNGSLDQFRLYNSVLTAAEVNQLFVNKQ